MELATFGAGCFWGVEETFRKLNGVLETSVGYAGGQKENPTYEDVCHSNTGHAEVVHLKFDPAVISYTQLLQTFFDNHNPTQFNRQGPDYGSQYRSVVFYHNAEQQAEAEKMKSDLNASGRFGERKVVTAIEPFTNYFPAEDYHQKYLMKRGLGSCHI